MNYLLSHPVTVGMLLLQHLQMITLALAIAVIIALPLALTILRYPWLRVPLLGLLGILYTIPSLALMILLIPVFGLNAITVVAAVVLYAQVILVRNLTVGLQAIPAEILEAAAGLGMNAWQCWWQVQVPLVLPIFLAGLRLAAIVGIAIITVGAKFGAGGLGVLLFDGIAQAGRYDKIWTGAIAVAALALTFNLGLLTAERATNSINSKSS